MTSMAGSFKSQKNIHVRFYIPEQLFTFPRLIRHINQYMYLLRTL